jgi:quinoprotein relay system zinc metallohydrolase 2
LIDAGIARRPCAACALSMCLLQFAPLPARADSPAPSFNLSEPAPGVFVHQGRHESLTAPGHDDIANIGFIVGANCIAVIDTGGSIRTGRALRAAIREHSQRRICYVINTHVHFDHLLGNAAFKDDAPSFVGSAALAAAVARSREFFIKQYAGELERPDADQIIGPDRLVGGELTLDLGRRQLTLRAWPVAHSDCDLTVLEQRTRTLWAGDLLFRERLPAVDGSVQGWLSALDDLGKMGARLAIPGHGTATRDLAGALLPERRYLNALIDGVREELAQGRPLQHALAHVAQQEQRHWLLWDETNPRNVSRVYRELEWQ